MNRPSPQPLRWPWRLVRGRAPHLRLGARGERIAARALRRAGYRIVARNYRPGQRQGDAELDLIAWEGRTLAVVEVKTRRGGIGAPAERVDGEKRRRIRRSARRMWRRETERRRIPPGSALRFDVVEVWFPAVPRGGLAAPLREALRRPVVRIHRNVF